MKVMTKENIFDDFAFIIEITDEQLEVISDHPEYITNNAPLMIELVQAHGNNAHILQLTLNSEVTIVKYIAKLLKYYDSVSWFNREHQFHIRRRECHQPLSSRLLSHQQQ